MMIEKMVNNLKNKIEQAEQDIAADILKVFGYPNNIERQILGSSSHVRYVNLTDMSILAEMHAEIVNTELVINIFKNDILTTQVTS